MLERKIKRLPYLEEINMCDNENAIAIFKIQDPDEPRTLFNSGECCHCLGRYEMRHYRLENKKSVLKNSWEVNSYWYGGYKWQILHDYGFYLVEDPVGVVIGVYDWINSKFVIEMRQFGIYTDFIDICSRDHKAKDFLKMYGAFVGIFNITTEYKEDDEICYTNPITLENISVSFPKMNESYIAILNMDGSIRNNCLFKGNSLDTVTEIINLNEFGSLENFKNTVRQKMEADRIKQKEIFNASLKETEFGITTPYLDDEVMRILRKK